MKFFLKTLILVVLAGCVISVQDAFAQSKKAKKGNTEQGLVNRLEACLANKDAYCYMDLWPDLDTLTKIAMMFADSSSQEFKEAMLLQEQPVRMMHADSLFKARLKANFDSVILAGDALGVHWDQIIPVRHELIKTRTTRNQLYEKMAPTRFVGYLFFVDLITRRNFGIMVGEIMQINGAWYGGRLHEIYEANNRDEWEDARLFAKKHPDKSDSLKNKKTENATEQQQEVNKDAPRVIAQRKYYTGLFDNEIPVSLYVRGLKGGCPAGICSWEAIYKFGDQDDYIRLQVVRTDDGKWQMTEVPPAGTMDLELKQGVFTGNWNAADGQTGYDVSLKEQDTTPKKFARLDEIFADLEKKK